MRSWVGGCILSDLYLSYISPLSSPSWRGRGWSGDEVAHKNAFAFYEELLVGAPRKSITIIGSQGLPIVVYSDAFFRPYSEEAPPDGIRCKLGWVIFDPPGRCACGWDDGAARVHTLQLGATRSAGLRC